MPTGWRRPKAEQVFSSTPVSTGQPPYSHALHGHILLSRLDLHPQPFYVLQPQLSSSKRPEFHQKSWPGPTFSVDVRYFIIIVIFRIHNDYKNFERKNLVGVTWFPGKHHAWKSNQHNAIYCVPCSWNLQEVVPYPLCGETEKIVFSLAPGKV